MTNKILKLHNPIGHPYWQQDEYKIEMPDGKIFDKSEFYADWGNCHRVIVEPDGIYYQQCFASSGGGKRDATERYPAKLMIPKSEYDVIEYVGDKIEMSQSLLNDLKENGL